MNDVLLSLFVAAGVAGVAYAKLGKRAGYGNARQVWTLVAISFVAGFVMVFMLVNMLPE